MTIRQYGNKHAKDHVQGVVLEDAMLGYADVIDHKEWYSDEERNQLCKTCMEEGHYFVRHPWPCDNHVHAENIRRLVKNHACMCHKVSSDSDQETLVANQNNVRESTHTNDTPDAHGRTQ